MAEFFGSRSGRLALWGSAVALSVSLSSTPPDLQAQVTEGIPVAEPPDSEPGWLQEFRERRDSGINHSLGTFLEIDEYTVLRTNNTYNLIRRMRGVSLSATNNSAVPYLVHRPGSGRYGPGMLVLINGAPVGLSSELNLNNLIGVPMIRAIEVYGRGGWVPHKFKHFRVGQGLIIFWT